MRKRLVIGLCIMFALVLASFAGYAGTDEDISDMLIKKIGEQQLMGILAAGIDESISGSLTASEAAPVTVFSNGFEDSSGTGLYGFNTSIWEVRYGSDGNEADKNHRIRV